MDFERYVQLFVKEQVYGTESQAEEGIRAQSGYWEGVLSDLATGLKTRGDEPATHLVNQILRHIQQPGTFSRKHFPDKGGFVVTGRVPLILTNPNELTPFIRHNPHMCLAVLLNDYEDFFVLAQEAAGQRDDVLRNLFGPRTQLSLVRYSQDKSAQGIDDKIQEALDIRLGKADATLNYRKREIDGLLANLLSTQTNFTHLHETMSEGWNKEFALREGNFQRQHDANKAEWEAFIANAKADIQAAVAQGRETKALKGARAVWNAQHKKQQKVYWWGLAALTIIVGLGIAALIYWWNEVYEAIPKNSNKEIITSALALFVVPGVAIAWVLRIIVRMVNNAMTLSEDSEHRKAMLETYFELVGDKEAGMEQKDRILILNAIFRPLPGHQPNEVNPPTVLELAKEALSPDKK